MHEAATPLKTLLLEDDENDAKLIVRWLEQGGYAVEFQIVQTEEALHAVLDSWLPDIVLSDHSMPNLDSLRGLEILREHGVEVPVVLVSGMIGEEAAVEVMRQGASDFVSKFNPARLGPAVRRALEAHRLRLEHDRARQALFESEARYHYLFDHALHGVLLMTDMRFVDCNAMAAEIFNYPRDDLVGMTPLDFSPEYQPDGQRSADKAETIIQAALAGERQSFEWGHVTRDGREILAEVHLGRLDEIPGVNLHAIMHDITQQRTLEQRERFHHAMLQGISDGTSDIIYVKDLEGRYLHINRAGVMGMDCSIEELLGRTDAEIFPPHVAARLAEQDRRVLLSGKTLMFEEQAKPEGIERQMQTVLGVCRDVDDKVIGVFGISRDVTEQRQVEAERHKLSRALEQAGDAVLITDVERRIEYVNPAFERITGYAATEVIGKTPRLLSSGKTEPAVKARLERALAAGEEFHGVFINRRRNGRIYYADMSVAPVRDEHGDVTHYIATHYDVTEKLRTEQELERLTYYNPITGLGNRSLILDRLEQLLSQLEDPASRIAVLQIDLDGFGRINESYGQAVGDQVLQTVGERLVELSGPNASQGHVSGDTFIILIPLFDPSEGIEHTLDRIQTGIAKPIKVEDREVLITASIGLAFSPDDATVAEQLLQQAEAALHRAKQFGSEQVAFYAHGMTEESQLWIETHASLRQALEQEQFLLEYQPKVCIEDGRIEGAEALLRWQHPERGRVAPDGFVPLLEKTGLIVPVGTWVLREACRQIVAWHSKLTLSRENSPALRVSVNLSLEQFRQRELTEVVREILTETGTDPGTLELELTETSLVQDPESAARVLHGLRNLGVRIALDDFGKGYSSLTYLRQFPIDVLKIDREFIHWITESPQDAAILQAVLRLTRDLGIEAVAEGVETEEQLRFLIAEGCHYAQGYYFSRPLPPDEFERLLGRGESFSLPDLSNDNSETGQS